MGTFNLHRLIAEEQDPSFKGELTMRDFGDCNLDQWWRLMMVHDYVKLEVSTRLSHDAISDWSAPAECHTDESNSHNDAIARLEEEYGITIKEMKSYWGEKMLNKTIDRIYGQHSVGY